MGTTTLCETIAVAPSTASGGRILVRIISAGWGSSGYYSPEAVEQAAKDRVWPVLAEQERRANLERIPGQIATLRQQYVDGGGDLANLEA